MNVNTLCSIRYVKAEKTIYNFAFQNNKIVEGGNTYDPDLFPEFVMQASGSLILKEFKNYPFFYSSEDADAALLPSYTTKRLSILNQFINFLWLRKDNSVNVGVIICHIPDANTIMQSMKQSAYSNAKGRYEETLLSNEDMDYTLKSFLKFIENSNGHSSTFQNSPTFSERPIHVDSIYHFADYNTNSCIQRAFSFLAMARSNSFLPLKISLYMSVLECLFTTDKTEVTHKVAERVALYLGGSQEIKELNYKTIKEAYTVRSEFFHGQTISKKKDNRINLENESFKVDTVLRAILNKVLFQDAEIFNGTDEKRSKFFNSLLFN
jgi:hypothetical protein